jgi:hypothetical protein
MVGRRGPRGRYFLAALLSLAAGPLSAAKTDVVTLLNGDRITGEVKEVAYGQLKFATDDMGTVYIEWSKVATLTTGRTLQVELADGRRVVGRNVARGATPGTMRMDPGDGQGSASDGAVELPLAGIVRVAALVDGAWPQRLDGSLSVGYSFTQAQDIQVFNLGASVGSRDPRQQWRISLDSQLASRADGPTSQRAALIATRERFLPDRWYREGTLSFTRNQELGLDLRSLAGLGVGRYLVQRADTEWRAGVGIAAAWEDLTDGSSRESVELQLGTSFNIYRFDSPQVNLAASLMVLPSLSESGRVRAEAALRLRREMVKDLFLDLSLYDSYDNRAVAGAPSNDWGLATSLGYSF